MTLLDTHALLWWYGEAGARLSARASREIARADTILVSPISLWEIAMLQQKGRIELDRDVYVWTANLLDEERVQVAALSGQAAVGAALLADTFPGDPADRFLYVTAREHAVPFVTKDASIRAYAARAKDLRTIW